MHLNINQFKQNLYMFNTFLQGFFLGLAYVAPIGLQNLYVINSSLRMHRIKALQVALITVLFDISLALACFFGIGLLLQKIPLLQKTILLVGSIAVVYIGAKLILSKPSVSSEAKITQSIFKIIGICFVVTWFNPQAIIDGSLLLGGFKATLPSSASKFFITGVASASFSWFVGLSLIVSIFHKVMNNKVLRLINIICGAVIIFYGLKLGLEFYKQIF